MKSILIIAVIVIATITAKAQTEPKKKLPEKLVFVLSQKQFLHLDSCINFALNTIDSKQQTNYIATGVSPLYQQLQSQLVIDTAGLKKEVKQPDNKGKKH